MNKKLRLVVTEKCHNKCPMCCNNRFDLKTIPVVDRFDYDEISITGGEPMLYPDKVADIADTLRKAAKIIGANPKIWLYTSKLNPMTFIMIAKYIDGVCYTPHNDAEVAIFKAINRMLLRSEAWIDKEGFSLRLNLFEEQAQALKKENLSLWKVKNMVWIKDCPIPEGEDFRRISNLL